MRKISAKNKKILMIIGVCLLILLIFLIALIKDNAGDGKAIYGSRLDGIEKVKISKDRLQEITKNIEGSEQTESVKVYIQGKIINSEIKVKKEISRDAAIGLAAKIMEKLSEDEKKFYDIQVFLNKDNEEGFPIIGYKHHNKDGFSWT